MFYKRLPNIDNFKCIYCYIAYKLTIQTFKGIKIFFFLFEINS